MDVVHVAAVDAWIDSVLIVAVDGSAVFFHCAALDPFQLVAARSMDVVDVPAADSFLLLMDHEHVEAAGAGCIWGQGSPGVVGSRSAPVRGGFLG
jgi:hypothetical protein